MAIGFPIGEEPPELLARGPNMARGASTDLCYTVDLVRPRAERRELGVASGTFERAIQHSGMYLLEMPVSSPALDQLHTKVMAGGAFTTLT